MGKNGCGGECIFEEVEGRVGFFFKIEGNTFMSELSQRNNDVGVIVDESVVEVGETEEGLDVFDFPRLRPVPDGLDLVFGHKKAFRRQGISEVLKWNSHLSARA